MKRTFLILALAASLVSCGQDHSNPTEAYEMFYTIDISNDSENAGKHFMFWGDDFSICKGWWNDEKSLCPVRMIYKGR